jgi:hypothetical protein
MVELHNEFQYLYFSPSVVKMIMSRRIRRAGHIAQLWERNTYGLLVGNPEKMRPKIRWVDNIKWTLER